MVYIWSAATKGLLLNIYLCGTWYYDNYAAITTGFCEIGPRGASVVQLAPTQALYMSESDCEHVHVGHPLLKTHAHRDIPCHLLTYEAVQK